MKANIKLCGAVLFTFFLTQISFSQDKFKLETSIGLLSDLDYIDQPGTCLSTNFGFKMKNSIWLNLNIVYGERIQRFEDGRIFNNPGKISSIYRSVSVLFSKDLTIKSKWVFTPQIGVQYSDNFYSFPSYLISFDTNGTDLFIIANGSMNGERPADLGIDLILSYKYKASDNTLVGLKIFNAYRFDFGLSPVGICPAIEFRF